MQKIFNYIRNAKGVGALWIFLLATVVAFSSAYWAKKFLPIAIPHVQEFTDTFFPIKVENGKVLVPYDTIISKTYHVGNFPLIMTLDTTKDFLPADEKRIGLYLTRSYLYSIDGDTIQRHTLNADFELKRQDYIPFLTNLTKNIVRCIFIIGPFFNFICFMIAIVFYAFLTGFACALNKMGLTFKEKMRLNTVLFITIYILSTLCGFVGFYLSPLSFFLLMLALQIIIVKTVGTPIEQKETSVKA